MPTGLRNYQHELLGPDGSSLLVFGTMDTGLLTTLHPTMEALDATTGDVPRVREDGIMFGEDYLGAKSATFELAALTDRADDPAAAGSDLLANLEGVWTDPSLRNRPGVVATLRSQMTPGVTRRAYGRPRRFADTPSETTKNGMTAVVCDFTVGDGTWYDDAETVVPFGTVRPTEGGFVSPIVSPVTTTPPAGGTPGGFTVGGTRDTWVTVKFHAVRGDAVNPRLPIGGIVVALNDTIPAGMTVTVDSRPWSRSVLRSDGASRAGKLSYDTPPLRTMKISRGSYVSGYRVTDPTGTSWCELSFRNAWPRW